MKKLCMIMTVCFSSSFAQAEPNYPVYGGIEGGYFLAHIAHQTTLPPMDINGSGARVFLGYQPHRGLAYELGYIPQLKKEHVEGNTTQSGKMSLFDFSVLLYPNIGIDGVFVKLGTGQMSSKHAYTRPQNSGSSTESNSLLTFGLGYEKKLSDHFALRLLTASYFSWDGSRLNTFTIGARMQY